MESRYSTPPSGPPQPSNYPSDKAVGIVVIVFFGSCLLCSGFGVGASLATGGKAVGGGPQLEGSQLGLAIFGLLLMAAALGAGIGILQSRRWGFLLGIIAMVVSLLNNIYSFIRMPDQMAQAQQQMQKQMATSGQKVPEGMMQISSTVGYAVAGLFLLMNLALLLYCVFRFSGRTGPKPL